MTTGTVVDVVMPQMGVSVSEGTVSRWLKNVGETIEKDETLLEISTDKVDTEVPSPAAGVVSAIFAQEGETIDVGVKMAEITAGGEAGASTPASTPAVEAPAASPAADPEPAPAAAAPAPAPTPAAAPASNGNGSGAQLSLAGSNGTGGTTPAATPGRFVSPVVARIAAENGINPDSVPGTGNGGRVTKKDILAFISGGGQAAAATAVAAAAAPTTTSAPAAPAATPAASMPAPAASATPAAAAPAPAFTGQEETFNFSPMRKGIAKHMVESIAISAHVTSTIEVDMTNVVQQREAVKVETLAQWGVKLTYTHFVVRALVDAIAAFPWVNAEIRGDSAVIKHYVNLGIAVALDNGEGLIVPVVHNLEEKNLIGVARSVHDVAGRARAKKLSPDDVFGGTITLTNPGIFGTTHGTPIINQPQVAIVDTEAIIKRAVVLTDAHGNDSIAIRSMMNLAMSYDHRLVDGAYAAQFLSRMKHNLEQWDFARFSG